MPLLESLIVVVTAVLVLTGLAMVGLAIRAYARTPQPALIHLSLGFALIVAAAIATTISAFLLDFGPIRSILAVNTGMTTVGYLFVIYSLLARRSPTRAPADRTISAESTNTQ